MREENREQMTENRAKRFTLFTPITHKFDTIQVKGYFFNPLFGLVV